MAITPTSPPIHIHQGCWAISAPSIPTVPSVVQVSNAKHKVPTQNDTVAITQGEETAARSRLIIADCVGISIPMARPISPYNKECQSGNGLARRTVRE